MAIGHM